MDKLKKAITEIGKDVGNLQGIKLDSSVAYREFPTYEQLQSQMAKNIKDKHLELGLDALIDEKLKNGGDPFVTRSKMVRY